MEIETGTIKQTSIEEVFKDICEANNGIIKSFKNVYPFAYVLYGDNKIDILKLTGDLKENQRTLFKEVSSKKIKGYVLVTELVKENGCKSYLRGMYAPNKITLSIIDSYGDYSKERIINKRADIKDNYWDFWGEFNTDKALGVKRK
jgi:hypothetical protein